MDFKKPFNELSILFPLLSLYTIVYLALTAYDFAAKDAYDVPQGLMAVYMALVLAYAADKEIRRWRGKEISSRKGAIFVYAWLLLYLVAFTIRSIKPEYALPEDLAKVALQVLAVFFGSKASKKLFETRGKDAEREISKESDIRQIEDAVPVDDIHEKTVLDLLRTKGRAKRDDLLPATNLSRSSLGRLMDQMEAKGLVEQVGERKAAYYKAKV